MIQYTGTSHCLPRCLHSNNSCLYNFEKSLGYLWFRTCNKHISIVAVTLVDQCWLNMGTSHYIFSVLTKLFIMGRSRRCE